MNELQISQRTQSPIATTTSSVSSVFDDFDTFEKALKMADALSRTQLIPQNFQGKPEDCLIALDFSRRLGLPPTAVLPHLYVIGGRPSTSAQFMISLVNRSGMFTRIQWEESRDGEVEYVYNGNKRKIPNYGAVAWFEEISTGRRYESPLIDVRFALSNGWLTKNDSKWQKMPEVMCRYRSASILIKTVCPELAMGMEFAEDAQDALEEPTRPSAGTARFVAKEKEPEIEDAQIVEKSDADKFAELLSKLQTATEEELTETGRDIADAGLPEAQLQELRAAFKKRREELSPSKAKKARKKKVESLETESEGKVQTASKLEPEPDSESNQDAQTIAERLATATGTDEQKGWTRGLLAAIATAADERVVEENVKTAEEWLSNEYITPELYALVKEASVERLKG